MSTQKYSYVQLSIGNVPQFEKLSINLERSELYSWKTRLSQAEKKKIVQIARIINEQQSQVTPKAKFRNNLEKSIENHMKRMAVCTGKNIRIIRPPPEGLRVLKSGEWIIPKQRPDLKNTEGRTKQLLSPVPMTIPEIETKNYKKLQASSKTVSNKKSRISSGASSIKPRTEREQMNRFKRIFKKFMKKRAEFIHSARHLQIELEDIRFESSATQVISQSINQMYELGEKGGDEAEGGRRRRRRRSGGGEAERWRRRRSGGGEALRRRRRRKGRRSARSKAQALRGIGSCPEFPAKKKP